MSQTLPKSNSVSREQTNSIASYSSTSNSHIIPVLIPSRNIGSAQVFQAPHSSTISVQGQAILLSTSNVTTSPLHMTTDSTQILTGSAQNFANKNAQSVAVRVVTSNNTQQSHILPKQRFHSKIASPTNINTPSSNLTQIVSSNAQKLVSASFTNQEPASISATQKVLIHKPQMGHHAGTDSIINLQNMISVSSIQQTSIISGEPIAAKPVTLTTTTSNPTLLSSMNTPQSTVINSQRNHNTLVNSIPAAVSSNFVKQHGTPAVLSGVLYTAGTPITTNCSTNAPGMLMNSLNVVTMSSSINPITNGTKTSSSGIGVTPTISGFGKATLLRGVALGANITSTIAQPTGQLQSSNRKRSRKQLLATGPASHQNNIPVAPMPSTNVTPNNVIVMTQQPDRSTGHIQSSTSETTVNVPGISEKDIVPVSKPNILNITALSHSTISSNQGGTIIGHALTAQSNSSISSPMSSGNTMSGNGGLVGIRLVSMRSSVCPPSILTSAVTPSIVGAVPNSIGPTSPKQIMTATTHPTSAISAGTSVHSLITKSTTESISVNTTSSLSHSSMTESNSLINVNVTSSSSGPMLVGSSKQQQPVTVSCSGPVYVLPQHSMHSTSTSGNTCLSSYLQLQSSNCLISTIDNGSSHNNIPLSSTATSVPAIVGNTGANSNNISNSSVFQVKYRPNVHIASPVIAVTSPTSVSPSSLAPKSSSSSTTLSVPYHRMDSSETYKPLSHGADHCRRNYHSQSSNINVPLSTESTNKVSLSNASNSFPLYQGGKTSHFLSKSEFRYKPPSMLSENVGSGFSLLNGLLMSSSVQSNSQNKNIGSIRNDMTLRKRPPPRSAALKNNVASKISDEGSGAEDGDTTGNDKAGSTPSNGAEESFSLESFILWHTLLELRHRQSKTQFVRCPVATNSSMDVTGWRLLQCANNLDLPRSSEHHSSMCLKSLEGMLLDLRSAVEQKDSTNNFFVKMDHNSSSFDGVDGEYQSKRPRLQKDSVNLLSKLSTAIELVKGLQQRHKLLFDNLGHMCEMSNELVKRHRYPALQLFDDLGRLISRASLSKHFNTFDEQATHDMENVGRTSTRSDLSDEEMKPMGKQHQPQCLADESGDETTKPRLNSNGTQKRSWKTTTSSLCARR